MKKIVTGFDREVCDWVYSSTGGFYVPGCVGIGLARDDRLIAGVAYDGYNGAQILMHQRIDDPKAITREFVWFCFWYPFEQLKVRRVTGIVPKKNKAARRLDEHLGFKLEAVLKAAHPTGDLCVYRLFKDECRMLSWNMRPKFAGLNISDSTMVKAVNDSNFPVGSGVSQNGENLLRS